MKRAQINNIFTMIMSLLVIGVLVLLAVRFGSGLFEDKCTSEFLILRSSLADTIRTSNDYGAVKKESFATACNQAEICFVDTRAILDDLNYFQQKKNASYFLMQQSVEQGIKNNIFSFDVDGKLKELGYVSQLRLANPSEPLCVRSKVGKFSIILKGQASTTLLEEAS